MNAASINKLLHAGVREKYRARVGATIDVRLPRLPITGDTEFVRLDLHTSSSAPFEAHVPEFGEGNALPDHIVAHAMHPGSGILRITAVDILTDTPIPDVVPLEIELTVLG